MLAIGLAVQHDGETAAVNLRRFGLEIDACEFDVTADAAGELGAGCDSDNVIRRRYDNQRARTPRGDACQQQRANAVQIMPFFATHEIACKTRIVRAAVSDLRHYITDCA